MSYKMGSNGRVSEPAIEDDRVVTAVAEAVVRPAVGSRVLHLDRVVEVGLEGLLGTAVQLVELSRGRIIQA